MLSRRLAEYVGLVDSQLALEPWKWLGFAKVGVREMPHTAVPDHLAQTGRLEQGVERRDCWVQGLSRQVDGPLDGAPLQVHISTSHDSRPLLPGFRS